MMYHEIEDWVGFMLNNQQRLQDFQDFVNHQPGEFFSVDEKGGFRCRWLINQQKHDELQLESRIKTC